MTDESTTTLAPDTVVSASEPTTADAEIVSPAPSRFAIIRGGLADAPTPVKTRKIKTAKTISAPTTKRKARNQFPVKVTRAPDDAKELRGAVGVLTLSYRKGRDIPWTAQIDPNDESLDNAEIPVYDFEIAGDGETYIVKGDTGRWIFEAL